MTSQLLDFSEVSSIEVSFDLLLGFRSLASPHINFGDQMPTEVIGTEELMLVLVLAVAELFHQVIETLSI